MGRILGWLNIFMEVFPLQFPTYVFCVSKVTFTFFAYISLVLFISNNSLHMKDAIFEHDGGRQPFLIGWNNTMHQQGPSCTLLCQILQQ